MITVEFRKHPDTLHWNYRAEVLGEDEYGTWLGVPAGAVLFKGSEPKTIEGGFVQSIAPGRWWTMVRNIGHRTSHYVDIITPATWEGPDRVTMVDLDLDVVRLMDGAVGPPRRTVRQGRRRLAGHPIEVLGSITPHW